MSASLNMERNVLISHGLVKILAEIGSKNISALT